VASTLRLDYHIRPIYDDFHLRPAPPPVKLSCYALSAGHATDRLLRASMVEDPCAWQKSGTECVLRRTICEFQMPAYSLSTLHRAGNPDSLNPRGTTQPLSHRSPTQRTDSKSKCEPTRLFNDKDPSRGTSTLDIEQKDNVQIQIKLDATILHRKASSEALQMQR